VQLGAQLAITMPHTVWVWPQGIVSQPGRTQATQAPLLLHWSPFGQVPQETLVPHPFETEPHVRPVQALALGVQQAFLLQV
jgi:hypothetical protein